MTELKPFRVPETDIGHHFAQVENILRGVVDPSVQLALNVDQLETKIVAGLTGGGLEVANRNRGGNSVRMAPLLHLRDGLWAFLGYQEEWSRMPDKRSKALFFRSSSIGIHFGYRNMDPKPQIFRAEWAGFDFKGGTYRFQGGLAGHPHWQFDVLESLLSDATIDKAADLAELLRAEAGGRPPPEFSPQGLGLADTDVHNVISSRKIASIHFASAAMWWNDATHAHAPKNVQNIRDWLKRSLDYIVQELDRV
ncbi:MAG: hypothetical protein VYD90_12220 [Pseudomonadota bacterium]|nr:hypothetical protein [Pseudomonadota bacterium]